VDSALLTFILTSNLKTSVHKVGLYNVQCTPM